MGSWSRTLSSYTHWRTPSSVSHLPPPPPPPVFSRDFAYADSKAILLSGAAEPRMASPSIRDASARTFAELLAGPTVDVYVGSERRHWTLHRNLLCHHSSWFETEFLGNEVPKKRKDGEEQKLELVEDDPRGFELMVKWLYQGSLDGMEGMEDEEKYDYAVACHKLYLLCDKFDMLQLKNISMDLFRLGLNEAQLVPDPEEINEIYRASPPGSPFRRLMTKIAARQIMDPDVDKDAETYRKCFENNPDFAVEMVNAIRYASGGMLFEDPTRGDLCEYHDHSDGQNCHVKGKGKGSPRKTAQTHQKVEPPKPPRTPRKLRSPATPRASPSSSQSSPSDGSPKRTKTNATALFSERESQPKESATRANNAQANGQANGQAKGQVNGRADLNERRAFAANTSSPRQLPKNRFNTIVRQLSGIKEGINGTSDQEAPAKSGVNGTSKSANRRQPRKLSVTVPDTNGASEINGHGMNGTHGS